MPRVFTVFAVFVPVIAIVLVCRTFDVAARLSLSWPLALHPDHPGDAAQVYITPQPEDVHADAHGIAYVANGDGETSNEHEAAPGRYRRRIVAVGDLHGDLPNARRVLHMANVVDKEGHWSGGVDFFVQTGDIIDRYAISLEDSSVLVV